MPYPVCQAGIRSRIRHLRPGNFSNRTTEAKNLDGTIYQVMQTIVDEIIGETMRQGDARSEQIKVANLRSS